MPYRIMHMFIGMHMILYIYILIYIYIYVCYIIFICSILYMLYIIYIYIIRTMHIVFLITHCVWFFSPHQRYTEILRANLPGFSEEKGRRVVDLG